MLQVFSHHYNQTILHPSVSLPCLSLPAVPNTELHSTGRDLLFDVSWYFSFDVRGGISGYTGLGTGGGGAFSDIITVGGTASAPIAQTHVARACVCFAAVQQVNTVSNHLKYIMFST